MLFRSIRLVYVVETDWAKLRPLSPEMVMRYSDMHAKSLMEMMGRARVESGDFTHAAFLDHDLVFKSDFVGWAIRENKDFVGTLFEDRRGDMEVTMDMGCKASFAPKPSAWHLVVSRRLFERMMECPDMVRPAERGGRWFDTMAWGYEMARGWGMSETIVTEAEANERVVHLWKMSFNYGAVQDGQDYQRKLAMCEDEYDRRFPHGIGHLLAKL